VADSPNLHEARNEGSGRPTDAAPAAGQKRTRWGKTTDGYPTVALRWPEPGTARPPEVAVIVEGLLEHDRALRELGHAHVRLDANARQYVARVALAYLEAGGWEMRRG
jgi:hypothetical protein